LEKTGNDDVETLIILENCGGEKQFFIVGYLTPYAIINLGAPAQIEILQFDTNQGAIIYIATILFLDFPTTLLR